MQSVTSNIIVPLLDGIVFHSPSAILILLCVLVGIAVAQRTCKTPVSRALIKRVAGAIVLALLIQGFGFGFLGDAAPWKPRILGELICAYPESLIFYLLPAEAAELLPDSVAFYLATTSSLLTTALVLLLFASAVTFVKNRYADQVHT